MPYSAGNGRKIRRNFYFLSNLYIGGLIAEAHDGIMPSLRPTLKLQETADVQHTTTVLKEICGNLPGGASLPRESVDRKVDLRVLILLQSIIPK